MSLPSSGIISLNAINVELGKPATGQISLNDSDVRALLGKPSGQISLSDAYGKTKATGQSITAGEGWNTDGFTEWVETGYNIDIVSNARYGSVNPNPLRIGVLGNAEVYSLSEGPSGITLVVVGYCSANIIMTINGQIFDMTSYSSGTDFSYFGPTTYGIQFGFQNGITYPVSFS